MRPYFTLKIDGERLRLDPGADFRAARGERPDVAGIERREARFDLPVQGAGGEEFAEGVRGGGESARHPDAGGGKAADHLAQRGVLAADLVEVRHPEVFKPRYPHSKCILSS